MNKPELIHNKKTCMFCFHFDYAYFGNPYDSYCKKYDYHFEEYEHADNYCKDYELHWENDDENYK
jgi:hypothetical protein